tara:strand:- start:126 stop:524 length:399 start_codon:yes stop_codon:yes gene_type:complete
MSSKILQLKLIENGKKCKKICEEDIETLKNDLHSSIDNLIAHEFVNIPDKESISYLKSNLLKFIKLYINLNRNIRNLNENSQIIKSVVEQMVNDVSYRCDTMEVKDEDLIKIIDSSKIEKNKVTYDKISLLE